MELNNKTESLKENGKTFYWASRLIDKKKFNDISELYFTEAFPYLKTT